LKLEDVKENSKTKKTKVKVIDKIKLGVGLLYRLRAGIVLFGLVTRPRSRIYMDGTLLVSSASN
jgi:hypothetical protein